MSDFALEPWEVPPGEEVKFASAPFSLGPIPWPEKEIEVVARAVFHAPFSFVVFLKPQNQCKINFVFVNQFGWRDFNIPVNIQELTSSLRAALLRDPFSCGRSFFVEGTHCFYNNKAWSWSKPNTSNIARFRVPPSLENKSSRKVFDWLCQQRADAESEASFAWRWSEKDYEDRFFSFCSYTPRWKLLIGMMNCIACSEGLYGRVIWYLGEEDSLFKFLFLRAELVERLKAWGTFLTEFFLPLPALPDDSPLCLLEHSKSAEARVRVVGIEPTQHERIEARLRLREWLQQNAPERMDLLP